MLEAQLTGAEAPPARLELAYPAVAVVASAMVAAATVSFCLFTPVECGASMALGPRAFVALLFGAWAGWRRLRTRRALNAFLLLEAPWLL